MYQKVDLLKSILPTPISGGETDLRTDEVDEILKSERGARQSSFLLK
jgi:hypothetical protein